jgi:membrane protease YdiL (CAAX protease family)
VADVRAREQQVPRIGWVLSALIFALVGGQFLSLVCVAVAAHLRGAHQSLTSLLNGPLVWWVTAAMLTGLWLANYLGVRMMHHHGLHHPDGFWSVRWSDAKYLLLGPVSQIAIGLMYSPFHLKNLNGPVKHLTSANHGWHFFFVSFLAVVGAPFFEELFFRGGLFWAGTQRFPTRLGVVASAVVSAVIFGLAHGELLQLPGLIFFGLVLATIVRHEKRIVPAMLAHGSFNGLALVVLWAFSHQSVS